MSRPVISIGYVENIVRSAVTTDSSRVEKIPHSIKSHMLKTSISPNHHPSPEATSNNT